jgi:hypothetical protein
MDVVILAGGRGGRLTGLCPPYYKPLLPINGVSQIVNCVNILDRVRDNINTITVVVAPENALPIAQVLLKDPDISIIVQREPSGPGAALLEGLKVGHDEHVLMLLGDNVMTKADIEAVTRHEYAVAVTDLPRAAALQYTWWNSEQVRWVEKVEVPNSMTQETIEAWCGPIIINRDLTIAGYNTVSHRHAGRGELPIGPYLDMMSPWPQARVPLNCIDIGHLDYWRNENGN